MKVARNDGQPVARQAVRSIGRLGAVADAIAHRHTVGKHNLVATRYRLVDTIGEMALVFEQRPGISGAVVENHTAGVMVLVKPLLVVFKGKTAVQYRIVRTVCASELEAVTVAVARRVALLQVSIVEGPAILVGRGAVVGESAIGLHKTVPTVVAVAPGTATVEVVARTVRNLHGKTVGIFMVGVGIEVRVAIDDTVGSRPDFSVAGRVSLLR